MMFAMKDVRDLLDGDCVYVKTSVVCGQPAAIVFDTDGNPISSFESREAAFVAIRQYGLVGHSLH